MATRSGGDLRRRPTDRESDRRSPLARSVNLSIHPAIQTRFARARTRGFRSAERSMPREAVAELDAEAIAQSRPVLDCARLSLFGLATSHRQGRGVCPMRARK